MAYYYRKKRNTKRKAKKNSKAKKSNNKVATRGYVKRILHKEVENKFYTTFASSQIAKVQVNTAPVLGEGLINLNVPIGLGNTSSGRIGNKVRVVKSKLNMIFNLMPYAALGATNQNPYTPGVWVKIWIFKLRTANDRQPTLGEWQSFFRGNSSNLPAQGSELDLVFPVETDIFEIYKTKTLFLTSSSNSASGIPNATSYMFASGKNSIQCSFDVTKHLGTMVYNDTTTTSIIGKNLWCFIQPIYSQQNAASGNQFVPINFTYAHNTWYEDA